MNTSIPSGELALKIEEMHCGSCAMRIQQILRTHEAVSSVRVELPNKRVLVQTNEEVQVEELITHLFEAGYAARLDERGA